MALPLQIVHLTIVQQYQAATNTLDQANLFGSQVQPAVAIIHSNNHHLLLPSLNLSRYLLYHVTVGSQPS